MALKLRLSRGGRKAAPYYRIVVTDSRSPRDGNFIEKLGTYNPLLKHDDANRVTFDAERVKYWISKGATPSDRVAIFLGKAGVIAMPTYTTAPKKSAPKAKAQARVAEQEQREAARVEAEAQAKLDAEAAAQTAKEEAAAAAAAPQEAPVEAPTELPPAGPVEAPAEQPADLPPAGPAEAPVENPPLEAPTETPTEAPEQK